MKKDERGAVVIEATIALTTYIFVIYTILTLVNICLAQAQIGVAVNCAAKEISQYTYLYSLTGLNDMKTDAQSKGEKADGTVSEIVSGVEALYDLVGNGAPEVTEDNINSGKKAYDSIKSGAKTIIDDPKDFILSCAYSAGSDLYDDGIGYAFANLAKVLVKKNLVTSEGGDCEAFLKYLRIVPKGESYFDGISFNGTEVFPGKTNIVKIVASYDIAVVKLLDIDFTFHFCLCGKTEAWSIKEPGK